MARDQRLEEFRTAHATWRQATAVCDAHIASLLVGAEVDVDELGKEVRELQRLFDEFMEQAGLSKIAGGGGIVVRGG